MSAMSKERIWELGSTRIRRDSACTVVGSENGNGTWNSKLLQFDVV